MCLQRSPFVARWPSGIRRALYPARGEIQNEKRRSQKEKSESFLHKSIVCQSLCNNQCQRRLRVNDIAKSLDSKCRRRSQRQASDISSEPFLRQSEVQQSASDERISNKCRRRSQSQGANNITSESFCHKSVVEQLSCSNKCRRRLQVSDISRKRRSQQTSDITSELSTHKSAVQRDERIIISVSDNSRVQHGCVVNTTAPRARSIAAACLVLAALSVAARCYAIQQQQHLHHVHKRQANVSDVTDTFSNVTNVNSARVSDSDSTSRPMPSEPGSLHEQPGDKHPQHTVSGGASHHPDTVDRSSGGGGVGSGGGGLLALVVGATLLTTTLGLITCVVSHYRGGGGGGGSAGGAPPPPPPPPPHHAPSPQHHHHHYITAPMLSVMSAHAAAGVGVAAAAAGAGDSGPRLHRHVSRDLAAQRDRAVRLRSVHTDLELDLPPSIALPDGEELPYGSSARLHIRDPEQESEIYQKCIRAPPNRTVFESESPPPYRSSSAGLLGSLGSSSSSGTSDWSAGSTPLVVRCHSMSSSTSSKPHSHPHTSSSQKTDFLQRTVKILTGRKSSSSSSQPPAPAPTLPVVVVPTRPRRLDPRTPHV